VFRALTETKKATGVKKKDKVKWGEGGVGGGAAKGERDKSECERRNARGKKDGAKTKNGEDQKDKGGNVAKMKRDKRRLTVSTKRVRSGTGWNKIRRGGLERNKEKDQ